MMSRRKSGLGCCLALLLPSIAAANWPGWRGNGTGVSWEKGLPTEWGPNHNIRWKALIDGDGISSPIIWEDKVFLTTAVESEEKTVPPWMPPAIMAGLLLVGLVATRSARPAPVPVNLDAQAAIGEPKSNLLTHLDRFATVVCAMGFVAGAAVALFMPEKLAGKGNFARMWLASGGVAMLGAITAAGTVPAASVGRLLCALLMIAVVPLFHRYAPLNMYTEPLPIWKLAVVSAPLIAAGLWNILVFASARRSKRAAVPATNGSGVGRLVGTVCWLAMAGGLFGLMNFARASESMARCILCLDRATGKILWRTTGFMSPADRKYHSNSYATPTPITDGKYVVANFGPGLVCLDVDGNVLWTRMEEDYSKHLRYGAAISPVMFDDKVIHTFLAEWSGDESAGETRTYAGDSYVAALDKKTGKEIWRCTPPGAHDCYASPVIVTAGEDPAMLLPTWLYAVAIDPRNGKLLWECPVEIEQAVPSMVADAEHAFILGGTHGPKAGVAIKLDARGKLGDEHIVWKTKKGVPECASPLLYDGLLYYITERRVVTCADSKTGEVLWNQRLPYHCLASPVAGDGKIYFTGEHGETVVLQAGREFKELRRCGIGEDCMSSPAISDGHLFIRGRQHLFCIEEKRNPS